MNVKFLTAQAAAGNQGILGPTKIYLAMQPTTESENLVVKEEPSTQVLIFHYVLCIIMCI